MGYMTERAAAAKWCCALLQTVGGYVRTAPVPLNKTQDKLVFSYNKKKL